MYSEEHILKKHKKHKKDKYEDRSYNTDSPLSTGSARLKLILKVGGSSTPEHSDSPGPAMSHVLNIPFDDDSRSDISFQTTSKKSKKKDKKRKKEKKHKHNKEKRRRERELGGSVLPISVIPIPMEIESKEIVKEEAEDDVNIEGFHIQEPKTTSVTHDVRSSENAPTRLKTLDKVPLQKLLDHLLRLLQKKDAHQVFAWPVTDKIAPGYSSIISKPMDFSTMRGKVDRSEYDSLLQFKDDFVLMCNNAMKYNHVDTLYYKVAKKLLQSGYKILDPDKIRSLLPLLPVISTLHEEQLGFTLLVEAEPTTSGEHVSQSEEEVLDPDVLDPTNSVHYVKPHPLDPPDICGPFTDDLTTEEVLSQARLAAREAAHRLAVRKPNSKMGFLRTREDGSTSLAILTPNDGVLPGNKEQVVSLGVLTGKLQQGAAQLQGFRGEDRKSWTRAARPLNYGSFGSFAPTIDSTFANLTPDEQELVQATYGDDTAVQYADSIIEFAKGCDYAVRMVDEILDTLTKGEHSRTVGVIEERKKMEAEDEAMKKRERAYDENIRREWDVVESIGLPDSISPSEQELDFESLHSLNKDLGMDMSFLEELKPSVVSSASGKLEETAKLIENLDKLQQDRLSCGTVPVPPYVQIPTEDEVNLADRVTENIVNLVKESIPASFVTTDALQKIMGIDMPVSSTTTVDSINDTH